MCGRPLGLQFFAKTGDLYIADAYLTQADGVPFHFVNGLDVDQATGDVYFTDSGDVYFTDSSTTYPRR